MRRILLGAAMAAMLTGTGLGPALAQGNQFQTLVYVNDAAVTRYELDQRLRFMQVLRAPENTPETAEKALIDDRLRMFAARQFGIAPDKAQIDAGLTGWTRSELTVTAEPAGLLRRQRQRHQPAARDQPADH